MRWCGRVINCFTRMGRVSDSVMDGRLPERLAEGPRAQNAREGKAKGHAAPRCREEHVGRRKLHSVCSEGSEGYDGTAGSRPGSSRRINVEAEAGVVLLEELLGSSL